MSRARRRRNGRRSRSSPFASAPPGALQRSRIGRFVTADGAPLDVLSRDAGENEGAYRVLVLPGSGCAGLAPIATAFFRGLAHGDVTVLHRRNVRAADWPAPRPCGPRFVREDRLSQSLADAQAFLAAWERPGDPRPSVLVGISEGAELVPLLADRHRWISLVVLLSATGLDPAETYRLQARRDGDESFFAEMQRAGATPGLPDAARVGGRSLGYWRDLLGWPVAAPLLALDQPVWIGFGGADRLLPLAALERLAERAQRPLCIAVFEGADHGLQREGDAPLQQFWRWIDAAAVRRGGPDDCAPLAATGRTR